MKKTNKMILFLVIIIGILLLLIAGGVVWLIMNSKSGQSPEDVQAKSSLFEYDSQVIIDNPNALQDAVDELIQQTAEGSMTLDMRTEAHSSNGVDFTCYLGNAETNRYDMFVVIYRDDTQEEIYRSGLIPIGAHIEQFTVSKAIDTGEYVGTVVFNQVEEDHETIHAQVNAGLNLIVKD
jgi:hypothetical protein